MNKSQSETIMFKDMLKDLGWKYKDVADRSGLTVGTISVRLSQGSPSWMRLALAVYHSTKRKYDLDVRERMKEILKNYSKENPDSNINTPIEHDDDEQNMS